MEIAPVRYGTTRGRMALYALGAGAFIVGGFWFVLDHRGDRWEQGVGCLMVACFALSLLICLAEMVSPRIGLHLDAEGIHSRQALGGNGFDLPWSELAGIRLVTMNRQPMVAFDAFDEDWGIADARPAVRAVRKTNRALLGSWMVVAPRLFGVKPETLISEIDRYHRALTPDAPVVYPRPA